MSSQEDESLDALIAWANSFASELKFNLEEDPFPQALNTICHFLLDADNSGEFPASAPTKMSDLFDKLTTYAHQNLQLDSSRRLCENLDLSKFDKLPTPHEVDANDEHHHHKQQLTELMAVVLSCCVLTGGTTVRRVRDLPQAVQTVLHGVVKRSIGGLGISKMKKKDGSSSAAAASGSSPAPPAVSQQQLEAANAAARAAEEELRAARDEIAALKKSHEEERAKLQDQIKAGDSEKDAHLTAANDEIAQLKKDLEAEKAALQSEKDALAAEKAKADAAETDKAQLSQQLSDASESKTKMAADHEAELASAKATHEKQLNETNEQRTRDLDTAKQQHEEERAKLQDQIKAGDSEKDAHLTAANDEIAQLKKDLEMEQARAEELQTLAKEGNDSSSAVDAAKEEAAELKKHIALAQAERDKLDAELNEVKENQELEAKERSEIEFKLSETRRALVDCEQECQKLRVQSDQQQGDNSVQEQLVKALGELEEVRDELAAERDEAAVTDRVNAQKEREMVEQIEKHQLEAASLQEQLDAALQQSTAQQNQAAVLHAKPSSTENEELEAIRKENVQLRDIYDRALAENTEMKMKLAEVAANNLNASSSSSPSIAGGESLDALREENAQLSRQMRSATNEMKKQHAVVVSSLFECGQRNLQLQTQLLAAHGGMLPGGFGVSASSVASAAGKKPNPQNQQQVGDEGLSFFEKQRRRFASNALEAIGAATSSEANHNYGK